MVRITAPILAHEPGGNNLRLEEPIADFHMAGMPILGQNKGRYLGMQGTSPDWEFAECTAGQLLHKLLD
jgi:hypothetical protein